MVGLRVAGTLRSCAPLLLLLLLAGCSGSDSQPAPIAPASTTATSTTSTSTTSPPPTTTTTSTTSTAAPASGPEDLPARPEKLVSNPNRTSVDDFDTSVDEPYRAAMELRDLFVYLEGNPTEDAEAMVALLFEPEYVYWDRILVGFRELTDNPGWRYTDPGVETLAIDVVAADDSTAVVRIADQRAQQVIADATGRVVKTYDGWDRRVTEFTLQRGGDGLWRYADAAPSVPISLEEVEEMVPVEWAGRSG